MDGFFLTEPYELQLSVLETAHEVPSARYCTMPEHMQCCISALALSDCSRSEHTLSRRFSVRPSHPPDMIQEVTPGPRNDPHTATRCQTAFKRVRTPGGRVQGYAWLLGSGAVKTHRHSTPHRTAQHITMQSLRLQ